MDSEQDAEFQRLTAQYSEEVQAGQHPNLSDYITRYPQYADAFADFIAYYHLFEANLSTEIVLETDEVTEVSQAVWADVQHRLLAGPSSSNFAMPISTLYINARQEPVTVQQLATALQLNEQIVELLEQHAIRPKTIPLALLQRLTLVLGYALEDVRQFFTARSSPQSPDTMARVAESGSIYSALDFLNVVESSVMLTSEQKAYWRAMVEREQKERDTLE